MFRADETLLERIEKLGSKLGLGRGEILRLCVEETIEKYLHLEGNLVVLERRKYDAVFNMLSNLLKEWAEQNLKNLLKQPKIQELRELAKEGKLEIEKP
jgi:hypothetical protein